MATNTIFTIFSLLILSTLSQAATSTRTINVAGNGKVSAAPDLATINTGVVTTAKTAQEALRINNEKLEKLLSVLSARNISDKDVQTSFFDVSPQFPTDNDPGTNNNKIIGYRVNNEVRVIVRDISKLGQILDAVVKSGSNSISGVSFSIADTKPLADRARKLALDDAKRRAMVLAKAAGGKVGDILTISETPIQQSTAKIQSAAAFDSASAVPIASGELDVEVNIFVLFKLI